MTGLGSFIKRNCKLFYKDKGMLFSAMITPLILLGLYAAFLAEVFRDSFASAFGDMVLEGWVLNTLVGGQIVSSLLAASCITVAFCCNMIMVQDKVSGVRRDLTVSPVKRSTLAVGYFCGTLICTVVVNILAAGACFIYLALTDAWCFTFGDVLLILLNVILLSTFGTVLSSIVNVFLKSQGQISAVGTIVSAGYGFLCGAYMPLSSFGEGLRNVLSLLPGTYGTGMIRNAVMRGAFEKLESNGFPQEVISEIMESVDCKLYFFGNNMDVSTMYIVFIASIAVLFGLYVLIYNLKKTQEN